MHFRKVFYSLLFLFCAVIMLSKFVMGSDSSEVQQVLWHKVFPMHLCILEKGATEFFLISMSSSFLMMHFVLSLCIDQVLSVIGLCFGLQLHYELISELIHSFEFIYLFRGHFSRADFHIKDPFSWLIGYK